MIISTISYMIWVFLAIRNSFCLSSRCSLAYWYRTGAMDGDCGHGHVFCVGRCLVAPAKDVSQLTRLLVLLLVLFTIFST